MITVQSTRTFDKWLRRLKDFEAVNRINARISRLMYGYPGDEKAVGHGVRELRIHIGPGYRLYYVKRGDRLILLLCGGDKSSQDSDIRTAIELAKGSFKMAEKVRTYDPAEMLTSEESIAIFMADAFETNDAGYIAFALGMVARAKGMTKVAEQTGLSREHLYRSFSEKGNPTLRTLLAVLNVLGIELTARQLATH